MKLLAFIPLLIWMLGLLAIAGWDEHLRAVDGRGEDENPENLAKFWCLGSLFWFVIGVTVMLCA